MPCSWTVTGYLAAKDNVLQIWCDFDRASSLICGNKMPIRWFLLQILLLAQHVSGTTMPIIRSSRVLYSGCCLWFSSCWSGVLLRVMCPVCRMRSILQTGHIPLSNTPDQQHENPQHEIPQAATTI